MHVDLTANDSADADVVEAHARDSQSADGSNHSQRTQPTIEDMLSSFDDMLEQALSESTSPPRRRFGDVIGIVADQPMAQHVQEAAGEAMGTTRNAANTMLSPLRRPQQPHAQDHREKPHGGTK